MEFSMQGTVCSGFAPPPHLGAAQIVNLGRMEYHRALDLQRATLIDVALGSAPDSILFVEHEPVITVGRSGDWSQVKVSPEALTAMGLSFSEVERGGGATYHGPGQAVCYPLLRLDRFGGDVHAFLRALERVLIEACEEVGVAACRRPGCTGVWVGSRKIGFAGVAVRRGVTCHGAALNVEDVRPGFDLIDPCGMRGLSVTSLRQEGSSATLPDVFASWTRSWDRLLGDLDGDLGPGEGGNR